MNIAVCVCQVPDTTSFIGFVDGVLDRSRVNEVMNPYDEYALEEAVRLKERFVGSVVTAFSIVSASAKDILRKALALGADRAVLVSSSIQTGEPYLTAQLLSKALITFYIGSIPDLVFCGKHSTDFKQEQVPSMLGELLGIASVTGVTTLNVSGKLLHVEREIEGGLECLDVQYPVVLSAEKGLNQPRKASIRAVMEAKKKTIELLPISIDETSFIHMSSLEPVVRTKKCHFLQDEKELVILLSKDGVFC
ncbi:MAG: electron transfer flavoprotein subunit beta/FixA family protein [Chlorobiaceae bacterium]